MVVATPPPSWSKIKAHIKATRWQDVQLMKSHSFLRAVREGATLAKAMDITTHCLIGKMSSGKSTLAESIAHVLHKELVKDDITMNVVLWGIEELKDLNASLEAITSNTIIIFDDVSYAKQTMSTQKWSKILETITTIRHRGNSDVRMVLLFNYHYSMAMDKFLRGADFHWLTSVTISEIDNYHKLYASATGLIENFKHEANQAAKTGYFGPKNKKYRKDTKDPNVHPYMYKWRDPFAPCLFYNNDTLRMVIYPRRQWIDAKCGICSTSQDEAPLETMQDTIQGIMEPIMVEHGSHAISGLRAYLSQHGIHTWGHGTLAAKKRIVKAMETHDIPPLQYKLWLDGRKEDQSKARKSKEQDGTEEDNS